jgi:hypothetical protein
MKKFKSYSLVLDMGTNEITTQISNGVMTITITPLMEQEVVDVPLVEKEQVKPLVIPQKKGRNRYSYEVLLKDDKNFKRIASSLNSVSRITGIIAHNLNSKFVSTKLNNITVSNGIYTYTILRVKV